VQHLHSIEEANLDHTWLTIGNFDGVHLGHRELIQRLVYNAHLNGAVPVVLTFYPHPAEVLGRRKGSFYLNSPEEKAEILGSLGVEYVITQPFSHSLAETSAEDFVHLLHRRLGFGKLFIGHDFALGRGRQGDEAALCKIGEKLGFDVQAVDAYEVNGGVVSSSRVRQLVEQGDIASANLLLGRLFTIQGKVVPGDQRGRTIGIPTANIDSDPNLVVPAAGVYACKAWIGDQEFCYQAAVNIGFRPTFEGQTPIKRIEAHLLDFSGDLYGAFVRLELVAFLRGEQRFASVRELVQQIQLDIAATRELVR